MTLTLGKIIISQNKYGYQMRCYFRDGSGYGGHDGSYIYALLSAQRAIRAEALGAGAFEGPLLPSYDFCETNFRHN